VGGLDSFLGVEARGSGYHNKPMSQNRDPFDKLRAGYGAPGLMAGGNESGET
jgi:hypothetical protein